MHGKTGITKTALEMLCTKLSFPSACLQRQCFRDKPQLQHSQFTVSVFCFFTPATSREYLQLFFSMVEGSEGPKNHQKQDTGQSGSQPVQVQNSYEIWVLGGGIGEKPKFALANDCGTEQ